MKRSDRRGHWRRDGRPKTPYVTKEEAEVEAVRSGKEAYVCFVCSQYHVGGWRPR